MSYLAQAKSLANSACIHEEKCHCVHVCTHTENACMRAHVYARTYVHTRPRLGTISQPVCQHIAIPNELPYACSRTKAHTRMIPTTFKLSTMEHSHLKRPSFDAIRKSMRISETSVNMDGKSACLSMDYALSISVPHRAIWQAVTGLLIILTQIRNPQCVHPILPLSTDCTMFCPLLGDWWDRGYFLRKMET